MVAIIDTGIDYTHPDLAANIWTNPGEIAGDGIDNDGNGYVDDVHGYDFVNNDGDPMDDHFHGTHTAGTVGAVGNNGVGVTGVNWQVKLMALKFLGASGSGSVSGAVSALEYAVTMGVRLSNNSWGGGGYSQALYDAIKNSQVIGHVFVAAAGNSGVNSDLQPAYPASYDLDNIISVAAIDSSDNLASFSNRGVVTVDLAAPGVAVLSTVLGGGYASYSGTSMATPHVTGAAALALGLSSGLGLCPAQAPDPGHDAGRAGAGGQRPDRRRLERRRRDQHFRSGAVAHARADPRRAAADTARAVHLIRPERYPGRGPGARILPGYLDQRRGGRKHHGALHDGPAGHPLRSTGARLAVSDPSRQAGDRVPGHGLVACLHRQGHHPISSTPPTGASGPTCSPWQRPPGRMLSRNSGCRRPSAARMCTSGCGTPTARRRAGRRPTPSTSTPCRSHHRRSRGLFLRLGARALVRKRRRQ